MGTPEKREIHIPQIFLHGEPASKIKKTLLKSR